VRNPVWEREKATWPNHELSRFVAAGGITWHVQQAGQGPVMLLIHGTGASTHSWRSLLPILARDYTVVAVDLPGHGFTDSVGGARSARRASIAGMSDCLAALLQALGIRPEYCVGHSAGAVILCRLALDRHVAPRVIVSLNGAFLPLKGAAGVWFSPIARLMASGSLVPRLLAWSAGNRANVARLIDGTGSRLDADGIDLYARLVRRPQHVAGALEMMGHWDLYRFERDLAQLETPLALIVADNDRTVSPSQAAAVKRLVAGAQIHRLSGLGHLAHEEQPVLVAERIRGICRTWAPNDPEDASKDRCDPPSVG
jgi:magnesium chelatase accessory protein